MDGTAGTERVDATPGTTPRPGPYPGHKEAVQAVRAVRAVGERWLREFAGEGDFVCSPAGLWLALGAVAAGARGGTAEELRALLGAAGDDAARAVTSMARELDGTDALAVATRVWSKVPVHRTYREALPGVGFGRLGDGQDDIDAWVREATGGLIGGLPVPVPPDTLLALVNVLALKARWETPFPGHLTVPAPFTDASGTVHRVPTMHRRLAPGDAWTAGRAQVAQLRCEGGSGAVVRLVLGAPGAGPAEVLPAAWAPHETCTPVGAEAVDLAVPRLALRTTTDVTPQLPALGVRQATTALADFSGLSPEPLAISMVVQEAVLKVAELGVEAAAATAVLTRAGGAPRPVRALRLAYDRPFGIVVLDASGRLPLFAAWQSTAPAGGPAPGE
ncbi:serine protease [Streptomyces tirandamycinicus]|uniref:Serine protease n=1 Tax=Streptomyces tirandamycinicus TaxID=2174846 RepID=A0A2S1SPK7_9ACTN|nr:serpin family protein [Streptomyces tirandamycinicus]AWI28333.1 serine protease [Streptomyces tirandamycinicus]